MVGSDFVYLEVVLEIVHGDCIELIVGFGSLFVMEFPE